tara:strand:+ start:660 stop:788 length:129 start_codon:yes stop_codon:yes gene_type:complete
MSAINNAGFLVNIAYKVPPMNPPITPPNKPIPPDQIAKISNK